ncbi:hypothetical protein GCM10009818_36100 [Nakamurella flavida]
MPRNVPTDGFSSISASCSRRRRPVRARPRPVIHRRRLALGTAKLTALTAPGGIPVDAAFLRARLALQVVVDPDHPGSDTAGPAELGPVLSLPDVGEDVQTLLLDAGCLCATSATEQTVHLLLREG